MLLPVIVVLIVLLGCTGDTAGEDTMRLTEADNGKAITVYPNGEFTINLESNPTTGYMWAVVEIDEEVLEVVKNDYFADPSPEMITGTGGREEYQFRGIKPGECVLTMHYRRSWEPDDPDGEFSVTVKVE